MRIFILIIFLTQSLLSTAQSINVEIHKFKGTDKLTVKSCHGCCSKKGYRAIYFFDSDGNAIQSLNYYKNKHVASFEYHYGDNGLLIRQIQTYDNNNKARVDTTKYDYDYDSIARVISKTEYFGMWQIDEKYQDFDSNNNARKVIRAFNNSKTNTQREFDSQNRIVHIRRFKNDTLYFEEVIRYNQFNDIIYSYIPTLLDEETVKTVLLTGGNRHSAIESYEYKYDNKDRWIKKFVIFEGKKILLEKRGYK